MFLVAGKFDIHIYKVYPFTLVVSLVSLIALPCEGSQAHNPSQTYIRFVAGPMQYRNYVNPLKNIWCRIILFVFVRPAEGKKTSIAAEDYQTTTM